MLRMSGTTETASAKPSPPAGTPHRLATSPGEQRRRARLQARPFRWFTLALGLLLAGYLFFNKAFAYLHIPGTPFFVGEIVFGIGLVEAVRIRVPFRRLLATSPMLKALLAFMTVCSIRLMVDLPRYRLDAVRDSSIWYYGAFAFLVAAAAVYDPTFTPRLLGWYRRILPWFLAWVPVAILLAQVKALETVYVPFSTTPINFFKEQDLAIHAALAIAYLWLGVHRVTGQQSPSRWEILMTISGILSILLAGTQTRGGFIAAVVLLGIVLLYLPSGRRRAIVLPTAVGLVLLLALAMLLDLRLHGEIRDISVRQVTENIASIAGENEGEQLSGTVEWRQGYWEEVVTDIRTTGTWLSGIGFGPILPDRYTVDVGYTNNAESTAPLRNVHNSHLTILARAGLPAFVLWLVLWLVVCYQLAKSIRRRPGGVRDPSAALNAWLLAAPPAILVNAIFDPALEGPHSAIWLFTLVGLAAAYTRLRRAPGRPAARGSIPSGAPAAAAPSDESRPARRARRAAASALWGRVGRLVTRAGWGVADQGLCSLANFAVGIVVARSLGTRELGAFSLAFATYLLALNASRGLGTDPLVVRYSGAEVPVWRQAAAKATGLAVVVGVAAGAVAAGAGALLGGSEGAGFVALGIALPGLLLQDSWRYAFFSAGRGGQAFANDLVWTLTLFPLLAAIHASGHARVPWFVLAWGGAAALAGVVGAVQARVVPQLSELVGWLREHRELGLRYLGENLSFSGAGQLRFYGLSVIAGLVVVGALRAAELLLGPLNVVIMGIGMFGVPEATRVLRRSAGRLRPFCLVIGTLQAGTAVAWGLVLLLLPDSLGVRLLGPSWEPASALLVPVTLVVALTGFWVGAWTGLRALGAAKRSLRAQGIGSAAYLAGALGGGAVAGAAGAAWGTAIATAIATVIWWWQFRLGLRDHESGSPTATPQAEAALVPGAGG
jgi:O-antigen/teichoic acid export membrane protein